MTNMEDNEELDPAFNAEEIPSPSDLWNYMEHYWHNNREFPESTEGLLKRKADLVEGKVPSSQLPSYVDDVQEFDSFENLPNPGEKGKIYLTVDNSSIFRWTGSEYIQLNSEIDGELIIYSVPNSSGTILTYNSNTKEVSTRTNTEIISDLSLMTTDTNQGVYAIKYFNTEPGNNWSNNKLIVYSAGVANPAMSFYKEGIDSAQLNFNGSWFSFINSDGSSYKSVVADGFSKAGSNDDYLLLGGGGHLLRQSFVQVGGTPSANRIYLGWDGYRIRTQIDDTFTGYIWTDQNLEDYHQYGLGKINVSILSDLDTYSAASTGFYSINLSQNAPYDYGTTIKVMRSSDEGTEIATSVWGTGLAFRGYVGGSYGTWNHVWHSGNLNPLQVGSAIQIDGAGSISNGSDTRTNKTWFDYSWAGLGYSGSVINFSGLNGNYSTELFASYGNGGTALGFRTRNGDTGDWNLHNWIWHSGNFNPDEYLPLSGGALTGGGLIASNGNIFVQQTEVGGNATGLFWQDMPNSQFISGIGAYTENGNFYWNYLGWGATPWATATSLAVGENTFSYKDNQVYHEGNSKPLNNGMNNILKTITTANYNDVVNGSGMIWIGDVYDIPTSDTGMESVFGTIFNLNGLGGHDKTQLIFNGNNGHIQYRKSFYPNSAWTTLRTIWDSDNLPNPATQDQLNTKVNNIENVIGIGFTGGDADLAPYFYHPTSGHRFLGTQTWVNTNFIPKTHPANSISQNDLDGWFTYWGYGDRRIISPSNVPPTILQFGFTSWNQNNNSPYADYLHFGGYTDSSGQNQNLIVFNKQTFGLRQYQGTWQSPTSYQSFVDYWNTGHFTLDDISNWGQAYLWGNHASAGYTTQTWVESQDYATNNVVNEKVQQITGEFFDPAPSVYIENKFTTIIRTEEYAGVPIDIDGELIPTGNISIINLSEKPLEILRSGKYIDTVPERTTAEYYITKEQRIIRKGSYRTAELLV